MKRTLLLFTLALCSILAFGNVRFAFQAHTTDGMSATTKKQIETNISALLTELNNASQSGRPLSFTGINIESGAQKRLESLWKHLHFECVKPSYILACLNDMQGYQVRGLKVTVKAIDEGYDQDTNRELTISINRQGVITGVRPAMQLQESGRKMMEEGVFVSDQRHLEEIKKFVEDFRCYYNERNYDALNMIYSDDALIITGSIIKPNGARATDQGVRVRDEARVKYTVQSKSEYMQKLKRIFDPSFNRYINVEFDHISIAMSRSKPNIYGVTLHQKWNTSRYSDEGWLFLLWDFNDPERPQIHIRAWQPNEVAESAGVFEINDIFIP